MKSILIQLDNPTFKMLERVAPAAKRQRAGFIRKALIRALMEAEEEKTRAAYALRPDSPGDADDWSNAEPFR